MKKIIKQIIPKKTRLALITMMGVIQWVIKKCPAPPPHLIKQLVVKKYARKYHLDFFIETGTYVGAMVSAVKKTFKKIISIEFDKNLAEMAKNNFRQDKNITILEGDSGKLMPEVLKSLGEPALFWLDGHYVGESTGKSDLNTPIMKELETIFNHPIKGHVVLIDDARLFDGKNDYPDIFYLRRFITEKKPMATFQVKNDIIRIIT